MGQMSKEIMRDGDIAALRNRLKNDNSISDDQKKSIEKICLD